MSQSHRLRLRDVRCVYRLIGECRDLGDDAPTWRSHMLRELAKLLEAQVGVAVEAEGDCWENLEAYAAISLGWPDETAKSLFWKFVQEEDPDDDPLYRGMMQGLRNGRTLMTRTRPQLLDNQLWYRCFHFNEYRKLGRMNECLYSYGALREVGNIEVSVLELHRPLGERPFIRRERRLLHLFHRELIPLVGRQLASSGDPTVSELSPRLRQTLELLLQGRSEKDVSHELGLSRATVHEYVTAVYRHFGVHSRSELLARWIPRNTISAPDVDTDFKDQPTPRPR